MLTIASNDQADNNKGDGMGERDNQSELGNEAAVTALARAGHVHVTAPIATTTVLKPHVASVSTTIMSESPPHKPQVPPSTPPNRQPPPHNGSTRILYSASEGPLGGYAKADDVKDAIALEFKYCLTTLPNDLVALNALFARHGIDGAVAQAILSALPADVYSNGRWQKSLPLKAQQEKDVYIPFRDIINHIFASIPVDPSRPPINRRWAFVSANKPTKQTKDAQNPSRSPDIVIKTRPDMIIFGEDSRLLPANLSLGDYERAIIVGEFKKDSEVPQDGPETMEEIRAQIGAYARYVAIFFSLR